jgi:hypothetical protein
MGVGGAGALMTAFQAVILWLPAARWPFFNSLVLSAGGLGALAATQALSRGARRHAIRTRYTSGYET